VRKRGEVGAIKSRMSKIEKELAGNPLSNGERSGAANIEKRIMKMLVANH